PPIILEAPVYAGDQCLDVIADADLCEGVRVRMSGSVAAVQTTSKLFGFCFCDRADVLQHIEKFGLLQQSSQIIDSVGWFALRISAMDLCIKFQQLLEQDIAVQQIESADPSEHDGCAV